MLVLEVSGWSSHPSSFMPRKRPGTNCTESWVDPELVWMAWKKYCPHQGLIPDCAAHSELLYCHCYPAHPFKGAVNLKPLCAEQHLEFKPLCQWGIKSKQKEKSISDPTILNSEIFGTKFQCDVCRSEGAYTKNVTTEKVDHYSMIRRGGGLLFIICNLVMLSKTFTLIRLVTELQNSIIRFQPEESNTIRSVGYTFYSKLML